MSLHLFAICFYYLFDGLTQIGHDCIRPNGGMILIDGTEFACLDQHASHAHVLGSLDVAHDVIANHYHLVGSELSSK